MIIVIKLLKLEKIVKLKIEEIVKEEILLKDKVVNYLKEIK